jgi:hypothetical protein
MTRTLTATGSTWTGNLISLTGGSVLNTLAGTGPNIFGGSSVNTNKIKAGQ